MMNSTHVGRKYSRARWITLAASTILCPALSAFPASAQQITPPPRQDTQSATGVSFRSGAYSYQEADLSMGGTSFPQGMILQRVYNSASSMPGGLPTGWTWNIIGTVKAVAQAQEPGGQTLPAKQIPYTYNVAVGGKSVGFVGGSRASGTTSTGGPVGTYQPVTPSGASLVFNGTTNAGYYTFTDSDGAVVNFKQYAVGTIANWTFPDGTFLDFTDPNFVTSNRGYAIIFESTAKACVVNLTRSYATSGSTCPAEAPAVTFTYDTNSYGRLLTSATKGGLTTSYGYTGYNKLSCIQDAGQSTCRISIKYAACPPNPQNSSDYTGRMNDYVTSQQEASSNTISYSYTFTSCKYYPGQAGYEADDYRPFISNTATVTNSLGEQSTVVTNSAGQPVSVKDPIGRTKSFFYNDNSILVNEITQIQSFKNPEGDYEVYGYDGRGNLTTKTIYPKPGSGLASKLWQANYPATCSSIKTCNKPSYVIDPNGNRTDFTYSTDHGGVLTETGPADVNGIHPVKRFGYTQRYAWILSGSGSYVRAASPVWVLTSEKRCQATATVGDACAGGAADEVVTTYDYGPDAGPNNLWVRGVAVTSAGTTRLTCYGHDYAGNRIWETKPRAGLTSCPVN